jgi:hypothetical protein
VEEVGLDVTTWHYPVAIAIATVEFALGLIAGCKPRWAACLCPLLHVGIIAMLLFIQWNYSVIPWNLATAIIGCWVLWKSPPPVRPGWEKGLATAMLIYPAGFYIGLVDHGYANVLYSDFVPHGLITHRDGRLERIKGWDRVNVPFPNERRTLRRYFERVAVPGSKLHIDDNRPYLPDLFYVLDTEGRALEIERDAFFEGTLDDVAGIAGDSRRSVFLLAKAGAKMLKREKDSMIYAIAFNPEQFDPKLLRLLNGLPNLEQVQLQGCRVRDGDLAHLRDLVKLNSIGLYDTDVSPAGLDYLRSLPVLTRIDYGNQDSVDPDQ